MAEGKKERLGCGRECTMLETVILLTTLILRVEITDVKLIRACLELFWWGEAGYTLHVAMSTSTACCMLKGVTV
jgi:hypothetical protein